MTDVKKRKAHDTNLDRDLRGNPGIGQSKGAYAREGAKDGSLEDLEGVNTVEGDVENEANPFGGVTEGKLGRTNR